MKNLYLILFLIISSICNAQISDRFKPVELNSLDWSNIQLDISDTTLLDLIGKSKTLNGLLENFGVSIKGYCHPFDFDSDSKIDLVFYWGTSIQNQLIIFKNDGNQLTNIYERFIDLGSIESNLNSSGLSFKGITYFQSVEPYAAGYYEINTDLQGKINEKEYVFYGNTKFPSDYKLKQPFEVGNDKYRLRTSPEIKDDNVICELASGDFGIALSSEADKTGRIWWFVIIENNKLKDDEYFHIDTDTKNIKQRRTMGWISSRYVIKK